MPIEIHIHFPENSFKEILNSLLKLPEELRPIYFGENEGKFNKKDKISDSNRFEIFFKRNWVGFFLVAPEVTYNFEMQKGERVQVSAYLKPQVQPETVFTYFITLSEVKPYFGYAAEYSEPVFRKETGYVVLSDDDIMSEENYRNVYYVTIGMNNIECGVGRDINKYIPGLYWYSLLSNELLDKHGVELSQLLPETVSYESFNNETLHLLKFFDDPSQWRGNAKRLDEICFKTDGIFSKRWVEQAAEGSTSFFDLDNRIKAFR